MAQTRRHPPETRVSRRLPRLAELPPEEGLAVLYGVSGESYAGLLRALPDHRLRHRYDRGTLELPLSIDGVSWDQYEQILQAFGDHRFRHTYDRGLLEICMTPRPGHEWIKSILGRMVEAICYDQNLPIKSMGSTTLRQQLGERGLEPDECYYLAHETQVRGRDTLDLATDPPPDLAIEIDVTSDSLARECVYSKLGVPELWRCREMKVQVRVLGKNGKYKAARRSRAFPSLAATDVNRFLAMRKSEDENSMIRAFVGWARQQIESGNH